MKRVSLEQLSDLVLVDIMAALPMWAAVRLAQLGHQRLQSMSCRPWVLRRMTDVNFPTVLKAYMAGGCIREIFCTNAVLRQLYGRIGDLPRRLARAFKRNGMVDLVGKIPGYLHVSNLDRSFWYSLKKSPLHIRCRIKYVTGFNCEDGSMIHFPNLVLVLFPSIRWNYNSVFRSICHYRPALLNGRHIIEVAKIVWELGDQAHMDRAKMEATQQVLDKALLSGQKFAGVWATRWS